MSLNIARENIVEIMRWTFEYWLELGISKLKIVLIGIMTIMQIYERIFYKILISVLGQEQHFKSGKIMNEL